MKILRTRHKLKAKWTPAETGWEGTDFSQIWWVEKQWLFLGIIVWRKVVDTEHRPGHAFIQSACLGDSEWKSKLRQKYQGVLEG